MQKSELFKSGWEKVNAPEWFPDYVYNLNNTTHIEMVYRALVLREPGHTSLVYTCRNCGHDFNSIKIHEEINGCPRCDSDNLVSYVNRPLPKLTLQTEDTKELINQASLQIRNLQSIYTGRISSVMVKDFGFEKKNGYCYFQFTGKDSIKIIDRTLRNAVLKAAIIYPFLWDFDFNWEKFGIKKIKIHNVLSILQ